MFIKTAILNCLKKMDICSFNYHKMIWIITWHKPQTDLDLLKVDRFLDDLVVVGQIFPGREHHKRFTQNTAVTVRNVNAILQIIS